MNKERWFILFLVVTLVLLIVLAFFKYPREIDMERELHKLEIELEMIESQLIRELDAIEDELEDIKSEF